MANLGKHSGDSRKKYEMGKQKKRKKYMVIMMMTQVSGGGNHCSRFIETVDLG